MPLDRSGRAVAIALQVKSRVSADSLVYLDCTEVHVERSGGSQRQRSRTSVMGQRRRSGDACLDVRVHPVQEDRAAEVEIECTVNGVGPGGYGHVGDRDVLGQRDCARRATEDGRVVVDPDGAVPVGRDCVPVAGPSHPVTVRRIGPTGDQQAADNHRQTDGRASHRFVPILQTERLGATGSRQPSPSVLSTFG